MIGYIIVGGVGFVALLVSMLISEMGDAVGGIGDHFDVGGHSDIGDSDVHSGPSVFGVRSLTAFVTGFGTAGALAMYLGLNALWAAVPATLTGIVMALIVWGFAVLLFRQQASTNFNVNKLTGKGVVTTAIVPGSKGLIEVRTNSGTTRVLARSEDDKLIKEGSIVDIVSVISGTAIVHKHEDVKDIEAGDQNEQA